MTDSLGFATKVGLDRLLTGGVLGGDVQELPCHVWGLVAEHMDERLAGHAVDEGIDDVDVGDVGELVVLLGETLDVLPKGLVGPLPVVLEVPSVPRLSVRTLEVVDEDGAEIALAADAARLKLLELGFGRA